MKDILLGFEVGTGNPVSVRTSHLIVTGLTNISGKTTTLEALIVRGGFKAVVFKTKIGEEGFSVGREIPPYYAERADWQFVESLLEATLREKLKLERSSIIRATKGATNLEDVNKNILTMLQKSKEGTFIHSILTNLNAYFEIVIPQLKDANFSKELVIHDGINIMDLEKFSEEVQGLVIRSVLEYVLKNERNTVIVIPESWKFVPEERGSPVKYAAESLIRQGATRGNYVYLDSQDLAGIDKAILKQVSTYILGIQLERNEVKHTLDQIPLPASLKPSPDKIMTLQTGHFVVCNPQFTKIAYAMPVWLNEDVARKVALGELGVEQVKNREKVSIEKISYTDKSLISALRDEQKKSAKRISDLEKEKDKISSRFKEAQYTLEILQSRKAVPVEKVQELKEKIQELREIIKILRDSTKKHNAMVKNIKQVGKNLLSTLELEIPEDIPDVVIEEKPVQNSYVPLTPSSLERPSVGGKSNLRNHHMIKPLVDGLPAYAQRMFEYLDRYADSGVLFTRWQMAGGAQISTKSSNVSNGIRMLKEVGLIEEVGDKFRSIAWKQTGGV